MKLVGEKVFSIITDNLQAFSLSDKFWQSMDGAFGTSYNSTIAELLRGKWQKGDFSDLPPIEMVDSAVLRGGQGAYSQQENRIYLSGDLIGNVEAISRVIIEEIGHYIDAQINQVDSPGDEGALFAALVQDEELSPDMLAVLKMEDDTAWINLNGQSIVVEQATFTSIGRINDTINGTVENDTINAGLGQDTIDGGDGNDLLIVDYSTFDGWYSGIYTSFYSNSSDSFNGYYRAYYNYWNYDQVSFSNIERFQITGTFAGDNIITGSGDDIINGGDGNNTIDARGGNNIINSGDGNDIITAGDEDDTINSGDGDDTITGGGGINTIDGGNGIDTVVDANLSSATDALTINDSDETRNFTAPDGTRILNVERFTNLTLGSGDDVVNFTYQINNKINNTINAGAGDDTINAGLGQDAVDGGDGNDVLIVDYSSNTYTDTGSYSPGISTNIYSNGDGSFNGSYSAYYSGDWFTYDAVSFSNIEQFQITGTVAGDNITTGDGDDTVNGGDGNDIISAGDGDDIINGSDGDDTITGGGGINTIDGGNGIDTVVDANLSSATDALTIDDSDTGKNFTLPDGTSIANVERFTNLTLGSGNDVVNFTHQLNNMIHTGAGNDTINSGLGRDTVISGRGDDHIVVNTASLVIIELPNEGNDTIFSSINYNLAGLTQIDNLTLTGTLDINGIGNRKDNIITGNSGQNVLTGLQGNDTFVFNLGDSVVDKPDRIGDFQFGKDKIRVNGVLPSVLTHAGNSGASTLSSLVDSVFIDANRALDGNQGLGTNSAALVVSTAQGIGGTYLIVNDGLVGFNTATDLVINLMGYSDGLPGLGNIAVGSLFV